MTRQGKRLKSRRSRTEVSNNSAALRVIGPAFTSYYERGSNRHLKLLSDVQLQARESQSFV